MGKKIVLKPSASHPLTLEKLGRWITIRVADEIIAHSDRAIVVNEAKYDSVVYVPRGDANMSLLERSDHHTYCPYKGEASYYHIPLGGTRSKNAVWTYEAPYDAVSSIKDYLAFYSDRVDGITQ